MNPSPFCMKVAVFLKRACLPCKVSDHTPPMRLLLAALVRRKMRWSGAEARAQFSAAVLAGALR